MREFHYLPATSIEPLWPALKDKNIEVLPFGDGRRSDFARQFLLDCRFEPRCLEDNIGALLRHADNFFFVSIYTIPFSRVPAPSGYFETVVGYPSKHNILERLGFDWTRSRSEQFLMRTVMDELRKLGLQWFGINQIPKQSNS